MCVYGPSCGTEYTRVLIQRTNRILRGTYFDRTYVLDT